MDDRVAILEQRVAELEKDVRELKADHVQPRNGTVDRHDLRQEKQAVPSPADLQALLQRMGMEGCEPIGAERVQQQLLAEGIRPEENVFSRGIIDMREE